jgi:hypothetical protein
LVTLATRNDWTVTIDFLSDFSFDNYLFEDVLFEDVLFEDILFWWHTYWLTNCIDNILFGVYLMMFSMYNASKFIVMQFNASFVKPHFIESHIFTSIKACVTCHYNLCIHPYPTFVHMAANCQEKAFTFSMMTYAIRMYLYTMYICIYLCMYMLLNFSA